MISALVFFLFQISLFSAAEGLSFTGHWNSTYGEVSLEQQEERVKGWYTSGGAVCHIEGSVKDNRLDFRFEEPDQKGSGWFILESGGRSFSGKWKNDKDQAYQKWSGVRVTGSQEMDYPGLWTGTFGKLKISRTGDSYQGVYLLENKPCFFHGAVKDARLEFAFSEGDKAGRGWFELSSDGQHFTGKWKYDSDPEWKDWNGTRQNSVPGQFWLVVLEARWEESLEEVEYSYGKMLQAFFARSPKVKVRHRYFSGRESLRKWCLESAFLPDEVLLVIAGHGLEDGLWVDGENISEKLLSESLGLSDNILLLHFSSCLLMKGDFPRNLVAAIPPGKRFPVSGYTTSVDWAASVNIEFLFFDLILNRGFSPSEAAQGVLGMMPFSGCDPIDGLPFEPAGFMFLDPEYIK